MKVPFLSLAPNSKELDRLTEITREVLSGGQLVMGAAVFSFESEIANFAGRRHALAVSSGSDAVFLALKAAGVGPGDEVITTSLSWIATANAIARTGATPIFCDIDDDLNLAVSSLDELLSRRTKAVLSVDFTGRLANYEELVPYCTNNGLLLVEDGSQAFGASRGNYKCGGVGIISAISHNPMKVLAGTGEAGSVLYDDDQFKERLEMLRYNGTIMKEECREVGINARMDTLQAAVLLFRLKTFQSDVLQPRLRNAIVYDTHLPTEVKRPSRTGQEIHSYYTYTVRTELRDNLKAFLEDNGIETKIQHPILMGDQKPFVRSRRVDRHAQKLKGEILSLPIHEKLTQDQIFYTCQLIEKFFN